MYKNTLDGVGGGGSLFERRGYLIWFSKDGGIIPLVKD